MINGYKSKLTDIYTQIRENEEKKLKERKKEIAKFHPEITELDNKIQKLSLKLSLSILKSTFSNDDLEKIKNEITDLRVTKCELLVSKGYTSDYLNLHYQCSKCKDTGYIGTEKCSCYKAKLIGLYYQNSMLEGILKNKNFNNFNLSLFSSHRNENEKYSPRKNIENILKYIKEDYLPSFNKSNTNLLFYGNPGSGKSFMSYCIAKELLDMGYLVIYKTSDELITNLRDIKFNNNNIGNLNEMILNCDLLIIDDLGSEQRNEFTITELFNLLNKKLLKSKKMIVSTNLTLPDITQVYSERIYSRLIGEFKLFKFFSDDIRISLNLKNNK